MGLLKATYAGIEIPIKIIRVDRNLAPPIVNTTQTRGIASGAAFLYSVHDMKKISIEYMISNGSAKKLSQFRRKMAGILYSNKPKRLVFSDEPHLFYNAVIDGELSLKEESTNSTGEITFLVPDGLAYSTQEKEVVPTLDSGLTFAIDYMGTYPSFPVLETNFNSDNGFIGFVDGEGHVLQFGNPDEADGENYKRNEMLATLPNFTAILNDFGVNYMHPAHSMLGVLLTKRIGDRDCMYLSSNGPIQQNKWNGGMKTFVLPPDSEGVYGAKNFYCYLNHWFETGLQGQTAEQAVAFLTSDNKVICGYSIFKSDMTGNTATLEMWANGKVLRSIQFTPSMYEDHNPFNNGRGHNDIRKEGEKVTFYWWGTYPSFIVPEIKNMECHKIQVSFTQYGDRGLNGQYVSRNYLRTIDYQKMHVEKWKDVPNKYMRGDTFSVDCRSGEVLHRGLPARGLGSLGNDWEKFTLKPGTNQIKCVYSSWAEKPGFKLKYREAYL